MINILPSSNENDIEELLTLEEQPPAEEGRRARGSAWLDNTAITIKSPSTGPIDETGSQLDSEDEEFRG